MKDRTATQSTSGHVLILNFHGIGPLQRRLLPGEERVWLDYDPFCRIIAEAATMPFVQITFDDGNESDVHLALPVLRQNGLSAEFFVSAGLLDEPGYLKSKQVRELVASGMKIGCHGMHHRDWRTLEEGALAEETSGARQRLEDVAQTPVRSAACPFGSYNRRVLRSLREAGYERVYTSDGGWSVLGAWLCPRNSLGPHDARRWRSELLAARPVCWQSLVRALKMSVKRFR